MRVLHEEHQGRVTKAIGGVLVSLLLVGAIVYWSGLAGRASEPGSPVDSVAEVAPIPEEILSGGAGAISDEIERRTESWADVLGASELSSSDLASTMDRLTEAILGRESSEDWWLRVRELASRRTYLCELLPSEHPYRGGEYCSP